MKYTLILLWVLGVNTTPAQQPSSIEKAFQEIAKAFRENDATPLNNYWAAMVELNTPTHQGFTTPKHAAEMLQNLFVQYPSAQFEYQHKGSLTDSLHYRIGQYRYESEPLTIYLLLRQEVGQVTIQTLEVSKGK